jgi:hypothetical protein
MNRNLVGLCAAVTLLVSACASNPKNVPVVNSSPSVNSKETPVQENKSGGLAAFFNAPDNELLGYSQRFGNMSAEAQKKELSQLQQALALDKNEANSRIKLAMVYSLPSSRYRDLAKANTMLDDLLRDKSNRNDVNALAWLLKDFVTESNKLGQKARDEQKRSELLQQKLDSLRNIEKSMGERDQGLRK